MPELPEVETIKKDLEKYILGKKITKVKINRPEVIKEPEPLKFKKELCNEKIKEIIRRGKLLVLKLKENKFLIIHLRINGWLKYGREEEKARVIFKLADGNCLNYIDSRLLGHLRLRKSYKDLDFVKRLGPEIFDLTPIQFKKMLREKKANVKSLIMDQHFLAGLGNIYAQEALFLAGIDPRRPANSLKDKEAILLYREIKNVLTEAIKYRGSSVDAYRDSRGQKGGMEERLKVYKKNKELCPRCQAGLEKIKLAGRGTCFCPKCQK